MCCFCITRLKHTKTQRLMGSYVERFSRILTKEVDEIQIEPGASYFEFNLDGTVVQTNTDDTERGPYDALNL
jgi:S-adenosylmethionine synthetase